jgi:recombination protein RecT
MAETKALTTDVKKETFDMVMVKVTGLQKTGELKFPTDYAPGNALNSAWLMLQDTQDKSGAPALTVCTKASIRNAMLRMVGQGLNPDKSQCYFIVYGNKLSLQRSYFGAMHLAKSVDERIDDIYAEVVYGGDEFEYEISLGKKIIKKHAQSIKNVNKFDIVAAYAIIAYKDGTTTTTIMTFEEIKQSWKQSKMNPFDEEGKIKATSTHGKFTAEMAMRTVINKACKPIVNSSSDKNLMAKFATENDLENAQMEAQEEIENNANTIEIQPIAEDAKPEKEQPKEEKKAETAKEVPAHVTVLNKYKQMYPAQLEGFLTTAGLDGVPIEDLTANEADGIVDELEAWIKANKRGQK